MTTRTALEAPDPLPTTPARQTHVCPSEERPGPLNMLRAPPRSWGRSTARFTEQP